MVFLLQVWMCWGKLGLPFLDTRLHYNYDNADFLFRARSGNRNGDLRSQLGVTVNAYSRWGERTGPPNYNTDHPFLVKAALQQYTKLVGSEEWASRSFYLAVSFALAAGLFTVLLTTTGNLLTSLTGAAVLVSLPVFAVYQSAVKFETDGMLVAVWLFVALTRHQRTGSRRALAATGILAGLAFLTHWSAMLFVAALSTWLLIVAWRRRDASARRALLAVVTGSALGAAMLAALMDFLQGGWQNVLVILRNAFAIRSDPIPFAAWEAREWDYAKLNFSEALVWFVIGAALLIGVSRWRKRGVSGKPLLGAPGAGAFAVCTALVAVAWIFIFRQGSFVHVYWQSWFCLPIAVIVALTAEEVSVTPLRLVGAAALAAVLVAFLTVASRRAYAGVLADQLGTDADIAFLRSLRNDRFPRFVFVPVSEASLDSWFQGPLFEYYTDRPVVLATSGDALRDGDKALVLRFVQRDAVVSGLERWSGKRLANEKCGPRFCAYDVIGSR
jgi:hypothetical protein